MKRAGTVAAAAFLIFAIGMVMVAWGLTRGVDLAFTIWLQSFASPTLDQLADLNTLVGQSTIDALAMVLLAAYLWRKGPPLAWIAPFFLGATIGLELIGKFLLAHPGPPPEFIRTTFNPAGIHVVLPSSFPSGHVARTTFFAVLLGGVWTAGWWRFVLAAVAIATPFARIYLGDHWLSDTIGGAAVGVIGGALALGWLRRTRYRAGARVSGR